MSLLYIKQLCKYTIQKFIYNILYAYKTSQFNLIILIIKNNQANIIILGQNIMDTIRDYCFQLDDASIRLLVISVLI